MDTHNHKGQPCVINTKQFCQEGYCNECVIYRQVILKTNDLKEGIKVHLDNGWDAKVADNKKGNIRVCEVYGLYTETGSVYSHDIVGYYANSEDTDIELAKITCPLYPIEHTPAQLKLKSQVSALGF